MYRRRRRRHRAGAEQAACAEALGIVAARADLNAELRQRAGAHVRVDEAIQAVRVGVHAGLTVVGAVGDGPPVALGPVLTQRPSPAGVLVCAGLALLTPGSRYLNAAARAF